MKWLTLPAVISVIVSLSGCSFYTPHQGFDEVGRETQDRISGKVLWRTGSNEDEEVRQQIKSLINSELSVNDAVQISLINNYDLQAKYEELGLAQSDLVQAGLLSNPSVSFERRFQGKSLEIDVAQNILSLFLLPMKKQMESSAFEAAKLNITQAILEDAFLTKELFYKLQAQFELLEIKHQLLQAAEAQTTTAKGLRTAGNITSLEAQTQMQEAGETKLKVLETEIEIVQLREMLNVMMGLSGIDTNWKLESSLSSLPQAAFEGEDFQNLAVKNRPDLLALNQEVIVEGQALGIANIESYIPELTIGSHYEVEPEGKKTTGPSMQLPIPIFNFGGAQRGAAKALLERANSRYKALEIKVRAEVRSAQGQMKIARAKINFLKEFVLPLQKKRVEQSQLQFNGMFLSVFQLIEAKTKELEKEAELVLAYRDYWLSYVQLERALGKELPQAEILEGPHNAQNNELVPMTHHHN